MGHANGSSDDTTIVKIKNKQKCFRSVRTGAIFALIKAPSCKVIRITITLIPKAISRNHNRLP